MQNIWLSLNEVINVSYHGQWYVGHSEMDRLNAVISMFKLSWTMALSTLCQFIWFEENEGQD